jgi:hypothetical protein
MAALSLNSRLTIGQDVHLPFPLPSHTTGHVLKAIQRWTKNNKGPEYTVYAPSCPDPAFSRLMLVQEQDPSLRAWETHV